MAEVSAMWAVEEAIVRIVSDPIRVSVVGERNERADVTVQQFLQLFTRLTGRRVEWLAQADGNEDIRIAYVPREEYLERGAVCYAAGYPKNAFGPGRPERLVVIPDDLSPFKTERCVRHELVHALGIRGHPDVVSVLNSGNREFTTVNDLILLRTLYDHRITTDMTGDEFLAIAPEIISELLAALEGADDPVAALAQR